jgi:hypothetical protein
MTIHKLQDLCYAYAVAEPVREMLFALQDRIDELEAQRKPLTDEEIAAIVRVAARGSAIKRDGSTSQRIARAIEAAHGIKEGT